jgi:hypothetical protein
LFGGDLQYAPAAQGDFAGCFRCSSDGHYAFSIRDLCSGWLAS